MTDEAKKCVDALQNNIRDGFHWIGNAEFSMPCKGMIHLLESLSAEIEQLKQEHDGLSIMLAVAESAAESAAETHKRERDAAIKDMQLTTITLCAACRHRTESPCPAGTYPTDDCVTLGCDLFEWRGVPEET